VDEVYHEDSNDCFYSGKNIELEGIIQAKFLQARHRVCQPLRSTRTVSQANCTFLFSSIASDDGIL
jgi:hypothetical protein